LLGVKEGLIILLVGTFAFLYFTGNDSPFQDSARRVSFLVGLFFGSFCTVLFLLFWLSWPFQRINRVYIEKLLASPTRLAIGKDGVMVTKTLVMAFHHWKIIEWIGETESHLFFYDTPLTALVIPLRAFRDPVQGKEFIHLVRHYRDESLKLDSSPVDLLAARAFQIPVIKQPDTHITGTS
jgi:hypothetical protein